MITTKISFLLPSYANMSEPPQTPSISIRWADPPPDDQKNEPPAVRTHSLRLPAAAPEDQHDGDETEDDSVPVVPPLRPRPLDGLNDLLSSSSSDDDDDDDIIVVDDSNQPALSASKSELFYVENMKEKRILFAMCIGLRSEFGGVDDPIRLLGDLTEQPYGTMVEKRAIKPTRKHLFQELRRRQDDGYEVISVTEPPSQKKPPSSWKSRSATDLRDWLLANIITNPADVSFIRREERKFYNDLVRAQSEATRIQQARSSSNVSGVVFSPVADMRLIHCLVENDEIKTAFMKRHDSLLREELDARNSPHHPKAWFEMVALEFNNSNFSPFSEALPHLHEDFSAPRDLSLAQCPSTVSPEQVKNWVADRKAKLVLFINRWERSGNGDGQPLESTSSGGDGAAADDVLVEGGGEDAEMAFQASNRAQFLLNDRPTLLYFWSMLERHDMLNNTVTVLAGDVGISSINVANSAFASPLAATTSNSLTTTSMRKKRERDNDVFEEAVLGNLGNMASMAPSIASIAAAIERSTVAAAATNTMSLAETMQRTMSVVEYRIKNAEDSYVQFLQLVGKEKNPGRLAIFNERMESAKKRLEDAEEEHKQLVLLQKK